MENTGFTQTPNHLLDNMHQMKTSVLMICLAVTRQTFGYVDASGKRKTWDEISTSRFMQLTGLSNRSVIDAVKIAIDDGWIERRSKGQRFLYRIAPMKKVHSEVDTTYEKSSQATPVNHHDATYEKSSQVEHMTYEKSSQEPMKKVHRQGSQPMKKVHTQNKDDLNKTINKNNDHLPGLFLRSLVENSGFVYMDKNFNEIAAKLETDYSTEQLIRAVEAAKDAHQKKVASGERGITAPLAYMAQVLAGSSNGRPSINGTKPASAKPRFENGKELPPEGFKVVNVYGQESL